jgi:asparagine synthase (glutamine-hydrolysing)
MCGIAGVFGARAPQVVERMLRVLAHRGPDDQHLVAGEGYTLGARRLSIIDLEGGRQPLPGSPAAQGAGRVWVAQNGEFYSFRERREELRRQGHQFQTRCDTEVIAHLYEEHGQDFPCWIEGMFAISLWDERRREGCLVRDRAGKKPLYYTVHDGALWYASEIKALLQVPGIRREVNLEALHHYLSYKNVPAPLTIFEGIHILPPAHTLVWKEGRISQIQRFWRLDWTPLEGDPTEEELAVELVRLLKQAVRRRLVSDVPVGFFLSGGVDSSLSTALAAQEAGGRIRTFTLTYDEDSTTPGKELDLRCAREIAGQYGTEHLEERIDFSRFTEDLPAILSHFDEPFGGVVSTYFLSRLISKHVKVALSGDGADELFGSYLSHRVAGPVAEVLAARREGREPGDLGHFAQQRDFVESLAEEDESAWRSKLLVFGEEEKAAIYSPDFRARFAGFSTREHLRRAFQGLSAQDPVNRVLEVEFATQLPDQVLAFVDRLSMAHSLEIRTGFLDTDVMEFAARIPGRFKIHGQEVKSVLKRAARGHIPDIAIDRPKEGFVMPVNQWLNTWLFDYASRALAPERLAVHGFFDPQAVGELMTRFRAGQTNLANRVLNLLCFQVWHEIYLEQRLSVPLGDAAGLLASESSGGSLRTVEVGSVRVQAFQPAAESVGLAG